MKFLGYPGAAVIGGLLEHQDSVAMLDRRNFLALAATVGLAARAKSGTTAQPRARRPAAGFTVINSMGGFDDPNRPQDGPFAANARVIDDALGSGLIAMVITATGVVQETNMSYFDQAVRDIKRWDAIIASHADKLIKVGTFADIERARTVGKLGVIYDFQNGAAVGEEAEHVDVFANLGLRVLQLTYNGANQLGCGALVPTDTGLTPLGRAVIERANANNVMVDLSHSGRQTCLDTVRHSTRPVSVNHTGCSALVPSPRSKTDEELRLVAEKGGYVGIYTMPYLASGRQITGDDVVLHIEHALRVCGEDHVGIGTDNAISRIDDMTGYMRDYAKIVTERRSQGVSAPGEDPAIPRFAADLDGPDQFRVIAQKLSQRGHRRATIEKIMSGNFSRFARLAWAA